MKSKFTNPLNNISVASPCSQDWNEMIGTERKRFCGECKLNVYNLSGMTKDEAENLILRSEGRLCVRFFRRVDGSILTKDCPVGWQALKRRVSKTVTAFASLVFAALSGIGLANYFAKTIEPNVMGKISPIFTQPTTGEIYMENTNTNVAQDEPIATMGNIAVVGRMETKGKISNFEQTKKRILDKQNR